MYLYWCDVICPLCGGKSEYAVLSVNPHKTHMTFGGPTIHTLECGHPFDIEGHPVEPDHLSRDRPKLLDHDDLP